ncbi:MAG: SDR family NAD(P)-dependent oxidoreductase [Rhodospirillaceae bacterium]|jgi:NAD(P)-dependent dehydrogenase (short-subunit alcohol dehydrogenase family)|nr:SDR family NAD(P)-dependent oxidoreductase [Rhodospirillaceae bacterium]MBT6118051.1 SDR family NAD(P)-dependent oxidoreductase [Rhodospirillaceae bacterium]
MADREIALIVGTGPGLSASLARLCAKQGMAVALAARDTDKLSGLVSETGARAYRCDVSSAEEVTGLFAAVERDLGAPDLVAFNPSARQRGPIAELDPEQVRQALLVSCFGGFLVGQGAAKAMLARGSGSILFTGATASVKGVANSAPFAMGKFGLRGLCQSMARELAPKGIHVAHFVIDGGIGKDPGRNARLDPDAIAETYFHIHRQHPSAWTWEVELRPWVEAF